MDLTTSGISRTQSAKTAATKPLEVLESFHDDVPMIFSSLLPKPALTYGHMCSGTEVDLEIRVEGLKNAVTLAILKQGDFRMLLRPAGT